MIRIEILTVNAGSIYLEGEIEYSIDDMLVNVVEVTVTDKIERKKVRSRKIYDSNAGSYIMYHGRRYYL